MSDSATVITYPYTGVVDFGGYPNLLKLYVKNQRLVINMIIRDTSGNPIIAIYQNTWTIYQNGYEYNYDNHAIEIVTKGERKVFCSVELRKGTVHLLGAFISPPDDTLRKKGLVGLYLFEEEKYSIVAPIYHLNLYGNEKVKPLFKYPKEKYLGVRADYTTY